MIKLSRIYELCLLGLTLLPCIVPKICFPNPSVTKIKLVCVLKNLTVYILSWYLFGKQSRNETFLAKLVEMFRTECVTVKVEGCWWNWSIFHNVKCLQIRLRINDWMNEYTFSWPCRNPRTSKNENDWGFWLVNFQFQFREHLPWLCCKWILRFWRQMV